MPTAVTTTTATAMPTAVTTATAMPTAVTTAMPTPLEDLEELWRASGRAVADLEGLAVEEEWVAYLN